jgi:hypothetical protein
MPVSFIEADNIVVGERHEKFSEYVERIPAAECLQDRSARAIWNVQQPRKSR